MVNFSDSFQTQQTWNQVVVDPPILTGVSPPATHRIMSYQLFTPTNVNAAGINGTSQTWIMDGTFTAGTSSSYNSVLEYDFATAQNFSDILSFPITVINNSSLTGYITLAFGLNQVTSSDFAANATTTVDFTSLPLLTATNVSFLQILLFMRSSGSGTITILPFASLCFPFDTLVKIWENGEIKEKIISEISASDIVCNGNINSDTKTDKSVVKRVIISMASNNLIYFPKNSLGDQIPHTELYATKPHPIFWKGARRDASAFVGYNGIKLVENIKYDKLYSLQFDHEGSFFANGVEVQSHSPYHKIMPLPKELRRIDDLETRETSDSLYLTLPLDNTPVMELNL